MKSYLYSMVLNQRTMHNKLVKEKEIVYGDVEITSPEEVFKIMTTLFGLHRMAEEHLFMISLNTKSKPLGFFEISHGTANTSIASPREIFLRAVLSGAVYIILCHNHPSLDCSPSVEDIRVTRRIKESGELIGIELIDHVIIGKTYCSLKEKGVFNHVEMV